MCVSGAVTLTTFNLVKNPHTQGALWAMALSPDC